MDFLDDDVNVQITMTECVSSIQTRVVPKEENIEIKTEVETNETAVNLGLVESAAKVSFSCVKCKFIGDCLKDLKKHVKSKHSVRNVEKGEDGMYKCEDCGNRYKNRPSLLVHIEKHAGNEHKCSLCHYKNVSKDNLRKHVERKHREKTEKENEEVLRTCTQCEYKSLSENNFRLHIKRVHSGSSFKCDTCDSSYRNNYDLKKHIERVHDKDKNHEEEISYCDQCTYSSPWREYLSKHKRRAHGESTFYCDQCPYSNKINHELKLHMKRMHNKDK